MATQYAKEARRRKREIKASAEVEQSARAAYLFSQENQTKKKDKKKKQGKKVDAEVLAEYVQKWKQYPSYIIRNPSEFRAASYNLEKNVDAFIRHCYVRYSVPNHLMESFKSREINFDNWFFIVAGGLSFQKSTKEYFTKQEANIFLNYKGKLTCSQIVWYAKLKALGCSDQYINRVINKCFPTVSYRVCNHQEVVRSMLHFLANNEDYLNNENFNEIGDYLNHIRGNQPNFSFKGRTYSSVVQLSNEWHMLIHKAKINRNIQWEPMFHRGYFYEQSDKQHTMRVFELCSNKELLDEGKTQRHCVYSYVSQCESGRTAIFTMRFYNDPYCTHEDKDYRITLEVNKADRKIVQAKHRFNHCLSDGDKFFLRSFAGDRGLSVGGYL